MAPDRYALRHYHLRDTIEENMRWHVIKEEKYDA
jgi:hypothetical protein